MASTNVRREKITDIKSEDNRNNLGDQGKKMKAKRPSKVLTMFCLVVVIKVSAIAQGKFHEELSKKHNEHKRIKRKIDMIRYNFVVLFVFLTTVAGAASLSWGAMASSSYSIPTSVISGGSSRMNAASYELVSTLGQPSPLGATDSASFELKSGFWERPSRLVMHQEGLPPAIYLLLMGE